MRHDCTQVYGMDGKAYVPRKGIVELPEDEARAILANSLGFKRVALCPNVCP